MFLPSAIVDIDMTTARNIKNQKGFTLIELLVVIGILAVLLAITLIAINPARQFAQANDTKRRSDVNAILNAIDQYAADNHGSLPAGLTSAACGTTACAITGATGTGNIDLCPSLVTKYLAGLPVDPKNGTNGTTAGQPVVTCNATYATAYTVAVSPNDNRVTVTATGEIDPTTPITVTR